MENERPTSSKRHSMLPQRSASGVSSSSSTSEGDDGTNKLAPPLSTQSKNRDVSPSKLPVGGSAMKRPQAPSRQVPARAAARPVSYHGGSTSMSASSSTRAGQAAASATPTSRRLGLARPGSTSSSTTTTSTPSSRSIGSRTNQPGHKTSASVSERSISTRSTSPIKETRPASTRILANVKVQRPASTATPAPKTPISPRKPTTGTTSTATRQPSGPPINKYALLSGPVTATQRATQDLRLELLHLHTLHKQSATTTVEWRASAKTFHEKNFRRLVAMEDELRAAEMDLLEQRNAVALIAWLREASAVGAGQSKFRVLSGVLDQMWALVAPGGRYTASVATFEDWYAIMERSHDLRSMGQHAHAMESLGDTWKEQVDDLVEVLCEISNELEKLGSAQEPSDLERCLNVLMTLLANMLEELLLIRDIEQKLVDREGSWATGRMEALSARASSGR